MTKYCHRPSTPPTRHKNTRQLQSTLEREYLAGCFSPNCSRRPVTPIRIWRRLAPRRTRPIFPQRAKSIAGESNDVAGVTVNYFGRYREATIQDRRQFLGSTRSQQSKLLCLSEKSATSRNKTEAWRFTENGRSPAPHCSHSEVITHLGKFGESATLRDAKCVLSKLCPFSPLLGCYPDR